MEFVDRKSTYPNRYTMTDENGNVSQVVLERADSPIVEGTPLNAETFNSLFLCQEGLETPGCYYHTVDGETEWLNPPMQLNTVYRTTKRFKGYPVYVVAVHFPSLAAAGKDVGADFSNGTISRILSMNTTYFITAGNQTIFAATDPYITQDGLQAAASFTFYRLAITSFVDLQGYSAICVIEFTKAEEAL